MLTLLDNIRYDFFSTDTLTGYPLKVSSHFDEKALVIKLIKHFCSNIFQIAIICCKRCHYIY